MGTEGKRHKKGIVPNAAGEKKHVIFQSYAKQIIMISLKHKDNNYKEEACLEGTTEGGTLQRVC